MTDWLLFRGALRDLVQPKRLLAAMPMVALPALLAVLWRLVARAGRFDGEAAYALLAGGLLFGFTLVILSVLFGTGVVAQELEQRTIVYLLTRPVARARILLAKFLGALVGIIGTTWCAAALLVLATFGIAGWTRTEVRQDLLVLPLGALAYGSLFLFVATTLRRPLIYGLFFAFGWESWVPVMPGQFKNVSIITYLRVLADHPRPDDEEGNLVNMLASLNPTTVSPEHARLVLLMLSAVALSAALWVFSRREYVPREDAE
jgi:ABC-2 type transport system permease protein